MWKCTLIYLRLLNDKYFHNIYGEPYQIWNSSYPFEVIFTKTHFLVEDNFIVGVKFSN